MALKNEDIAKIAQMLRLKPEDLVNAIKSEAEVDVTIPDDIETFTTSELTTLKNNEYKAGKEKGVEIAVKDVKEELGLEFQGKSIKGLLEAHKSHVISEAKIEPDKKVAEYEEKVKTLQNTVKEYEAKLTEKDSEVNTVKLHGELYKHIPEFGENAPALAKDEVIGLMKANGYEARLENGQTVFYKGGELLKDKLANAIPAKDVINTFLKEKKLVTEQPAKPGGRGAGDQKPAGGTYKNLSELKKVYEEQGKSLLGQEFQAAVKEAVKNPDFDMSA